jgi:hypothetical protein
MKSPIKPEQADRNTTNNQTQTAWRQWIRIHPAAELFPPGDIQILADDIKRHGQHEPVSVVKDDRGLVLLDGRSRLHARELAGLKIDINDRGTFEHLSASIDAYAFVISKNIHRRHLSSEDKRRLIAKLLEANPEKSDRQIAAVTKVDHKTVGAVRKEKEATGEIPQLKKTAGADGKERKRPTKARQQPGRPSLKAVAGPETQPLKLHTHTLIDRWDFAPPEEQEELVQQRWTDISLIQQKLEAAKTQLWPGPADDGLDIPVNLRRVRS